MTYFLVLVILTFSYFIGKGSVRLLGISNPTLFEKCTVGLCSMILISTCIFLLEISKHNRFYVILSLYIALIIIGVWKQKENKLTFRNSGKAVKLSILLLIVTILYSLAYSGNIRADSIRQRVGPDLLGWIASAQYVSQENSLDSLKNWLEKEFPNSHEKNPFAKENFGTRDSIFYTASYTKQLQAEFLIGAERVGIPSYLGLNFLPFTGEFKWVSTYLALSAFFHFLLLCWVWESSKRLRQKDGFFQNALMGSVLLSSYTLLFPVFEGSFGQHFSFTLFCLALNRIRGSNWKFWIFVFVTALLSYKDLIFISLPFALSIYFSYFRQRNISTWIKHNKAKSILFFGSIAFGIYSIGFLNRFSSLSFGGWEEGKHPSIIDIIGLSGMYTWQKQDRFSLVYSVFSISISLIVTVLLLTRKNLLHKNAFLILLLTWLAYSLLAVLNENNYIIWKSLPYFTIYLYLIYLSNCKSVNKLFCNILLLIQIICAFIFIHNWLYNSSEIEIYRINDLDSKKVNMYVDSYALDFRDQKFVNVWALMGEMEWGIPTRQIPNQVSKKSYRSKLYVIPRSICDSSKGEEVEIYLVANVCLVLLDAKSDGYMPKN